MFNRADIIDQNFLTLVAKNEYPRALSPDDLPSFISSHELVDIFESQVMSRHNDLAARRLRVRNDSFYTISSSGHEGNAVIGHLTSLDDMAFLHYRSGAFFFQRAKQLNWSTPMYDVMLSVVASADDPISGGRHKVLGSLPLNIPPQTSTIASHLPKAVGAALSISRAKSLGIKSKLAEDSIVICSFGDASANHAVALTAFNMANWCAYQNLPVPLLFVCEDNGIGISTETPKGWIEHNFKNRVGLNYMSCDGLNLIDTYITTQKALRMVRKLRQPVFLHMKTVRLLGHAGSDIETMYNSLKIIEAAEANDPLLHSARLLVKNKILSNEEVLGLYRQIRSRIDRISEITIKRPKLLDAKSVMESIVPPRANKDKRLLPDQKSREQMFGSEWSQLEKKHHFAKLHNWGLADCMLQYPEMLVFGEDVAKKGGVYNVTTGLWKKFGSKRVFNTPLDETSILGAAIGYAHNDFIPVPEIQFLAYVHNAEDQIRGEAATLSFFSKGQYTNPMVIRIAGLAYQKGFGGHFHNDNSLAVFRDIPGLILACPSTGRDAVMMFRACMEQAYYYGRVCVFIEPIALYMTRDLLKQDDGLWTFEYPDPTEISTVGEPLIWGESDETCIITYGNGNYLSRQAVLELQKEGEFKVKVIDIPWLSSTNKDTLRKYIGTCHKILIVDECRQTGSLSEWLVTDIVEANQGKSIPQIKRLYAEDSFIPLGVASTATLPSCQDIIKALKELKVKSMSVV